MSVVETFDYLQEMTKRKFTLNRMALGRALVQLGFEKDKKTIKGKMYRGYWLKLASSEEGINYDKPLSGPLFGDDVFTDL
jgi:hypothetical protein